MFVNLRPASRHTVTPTRTWDSPALGVSGHRAAPSPVGCLAVCWGSRVWAKDTSDLCIIKQEIGFSMHLAGQHLFRICAGSPQLSDWEAFHQMPKQALTHATLGPAQRPWAQPSPPASWSQVQGAVDRASGHTGTTHPAGCQSAPGPECGWWSWAERRMSPGEAGEWTPRSPNMK